MNAQTRWYRFGDKILASDLGRTVRIATVHGTGGTSGGKWCAADDESAALIAAAPDLLAALEAILELEGEAVEANRYGTAEAERRIFGQARQAIAKAKGEVTS